MDAFKLREALENAYEETSLAFNFKKISCVMTASALLFVAIFIDPPILLLLIVKLIILSSCYCSSGPLNNTNMTFDFNMFVNVEINRLLSALEKYFFIVASC